MTTNVAPPGWHPDPSNPGGALRWWDGIAWTHHTQQPAAVPPAPYDALPAPAAWPNAGSATAGGYPTSGYPTSAYGQAQQLSSAKENSLSLTAIGVAALYVLIAMTTHVVFLGIFPLMLAVRAVSRKESLASVAVIAAIVSIVVAVIALK
jgi:hypothetical protein